MTLINYDINKFLMDVICSLLSLFMTNISVGYCLYLKINDVITLPLVEK